MVIRKMALRTMDQVVTMSLIRTPIMRVTGMTMILMMRPTVKPIGASTATSKPMTSVTPGMTLNSSQNQRPSVMMRPNRMPTTSRPISRPMLGANSSQNRARCLTALTSW